MIRHRVIAWTLLATFATAGPAQEISREERLKAHRARIQEIIEKRQKEDAEKAKAAADAAAATAGAAVATPTPAPGSPPPPGAPAPQAPAPPGFPLNAGAPLQPASPGGPQPGRPPGPPNAAAGPQGQVKGARSEARSMMFFYPFDSTVGVGETFVTEVCADTKQGTVDRVSFLIRYDRDVLNPLAVDHRPLEGLAEGEIAFAHDAERGEVYLEAKLKRATNLTGRPLAIVTWEALRADSGSTVRFGSGAGGRKTGLYIDGANQLGSSAAAGDGVVNATVNVRDPRRGSEVQQVGGGGLLIAPAGEAPPPPTMALRLVQSHQGVAVGEQFHVDVVLDNPERAPLDRVAFYLQFDPALAEVLDSDRGNSLRLGTNVEDGFAAERFPFDFYRENEADNRAGTVVYRAGFGSGAVRAAGTLARIHFLAKAPTERLDIVLAQNDPGYHPTTSVTYLEQGMLKGVAERAAAVDGVSVAVTGSEAVLTAPAEGPVVRRSGRGVAVTTSRLGKQRGLN